MSEKVLNILSKQGLLENNKIEPLKFCEHCFYGKQHWVKFPNVVHTTKAMLNYVHFDCWGPSRVPSLGGARYFLSIIDDYSRMTWVIMMKQKFAAFKFFKHQTILMNNHTRKIVKCLRTDYGLRFCKDEGISR